MCRVDKRANCVVWCGNLPSSVDDRAVRAFFSTSQFIVRALNHVPSTQSAFIQLSSSDQVAPFISMYNGALFLDKAVICHAKKPPTCLVQTVQAQPNNAYTSTPIAQIPTVRTLPSNSVAHSVVLFEPATMAPLGLSAEPSESPAGPWASSIQPFSYSAPSALYPRDRYFILKTHSPQDVAFSQQCGVWAYSNNYMELVLRGAYEGCDNVFLIFGVNGSGGFCGVARMAGIGSEEAGLYVRDFRARNPIWTDTGKDWTVPFQVQWISGNFVPFEEMMHLNNPWNHNCLVRKSRDGVEVEPNVGYNLCWLLTNRL
ncbi:YT521-B-like domain-containing protein [Chytriomyces sp. MP71]|nr:YT521-B-like domain-containing protein [Chytriomyces sp. MP71]